MRTCRRCSTEKPESQFYPNHDGFRPECKRCTSRSNNPRARAYMRALRELRVRHPEEFETILGEEYDRICGDR